MKVRFFERMNRIFAPCIAGRGYDWELHIDETPCDLWTIHGRFPPKEARKTRCLGLQKIARLPAPTPKLHAGEKQISFTRALESRSPLRLA